MRPIFGMLLVLLTLTACGTSANDPAPVQPPAQAPVPIPSQVPPVPTPTPKPTPTPIPWWKQGYQSNWTGLHGGELPSEFTTTVEEGYSFPFLYDAGWQVRTEDGTNVLAATATSSAYEPLSFLHYTGVGFGPNGLLPSRYRIDVEARSLGGANRYHGFGELAIQAFYVDPKTYVEVVQNDRQLSLWEARGAEPNGSTGWKLLAQYAHEATTSAWVKFGAGVDLGAGKIWLLVDGQPVANASSGLLTGATGSFAIRATGNLEEWRSIAAEEVK